MQNIYPLNTHAHTQTQTHTQRERKRNIYITNNYFTLLIIMFFSWKRMWEVVLGWIPLKIKQAIRDIRPYIKRVSWKNHKSLNKGKFYKTKSINMLIFINIYLLHPKINSGLGHNFLSFCTNHGRFFKYAVLGLRKKFQRDLEMDDNQSKWLRLIKEGLLDSLKKWGCYAIEKNFTQLYFKVMNDLRFD